MSYSRGPQFDPDFAPEDEKGKWAPPSDHEIRRDLLPIESAFQVAGTLGMLLSASVFVLFAVPTSFMLRGAGDPDGLFLGEDWLWRRWVARMASVMTLAILAAVMSWGLSRRRPWARWALIVLGGAPPLVFVVRLGLRLLGVIPTHEDLDRFMPMACASVFVLPASIKAIGSACRRSGRAVLGPAYDGLVARTPKLSARWRDGLLHGLALTLAMFVLHWTLLLMFLGVLAARGVIRSI